MLVAWYDIPVTHGPFPFTVRHVLENASSFATTCRVCCLGVAFAGLNLADNLKNTEE
jgi:hypothetical protein